MSRSHLYVIVPVYNESENLEELIKSFKVMEEEYKNIHNACFILVDDGSTDNTGVIAEKLASGLNLVVLKHEENKGPGKAFAAAFEYLSEKIEDHDWVVTMEGDNTSRYETFRQMFTRTEEGYDVVLASPYMYGGGIVNTSTMRMLLSHIANAFVKEFLGLHGIITMSSFFRLYKGSVLRKLQSCYGTQVVECAGFECMIELLIKLVHLQTTISEVPMLLDTSIRKGKSKMKIFRTIRGYLTLGIIKKRWIK